MKKVDYLKKDLMYGHTQDFNLNLLLSRERALLLFAAADLSISLLTKAALFDIRELR